MQGVFKYHLDNMYMKKLTPRVHGLHRRILVASYTLDRVDAITMLATDFVCAHGVE